MKIRIAGKANDSIVDGVGLRYTLFVQGCPHKCKGCHNPQTHSFSGGKEESTENILEEIKKNKIITGVTFSGGEPFCQAKPLSILGKGIKRLKLNLCVYSGYTFEELLELAEDNNDVKELLEVCDILVDGKFIIEQKTLNKRFVGSSNQRCIDLKESLKQGKAILAKDWQ